MRGLSKQLRIPPQLETVKAFDDDRDEPYRYSGAAVNATLDEFVSDGRAGMKSLKSTLMPALPFFMAGELQRFLQPQYVSL